MTLEQIRAANDEQINLAVAALQNGRCLDYSRDLNAAMTLVPQGDDKKIWEFGVELSKVIGREFMLRTSTGLSWHYWASFETNKPRALAEAFLLWKGSAT